MSVFIADRGRYARLSPDPDSLDLATLVQSSAIKLLRNCWVQYNLILSILVGHTGRC